jgi:hypothetical protein
MSFSISHFHFAQCTQRMILGTVVGGLADTCGRKKLCICYSFVYIVSALTNHIKEFYVQLLGRVCSGVATSLFYSTFESWFICAHDERGLGRSKKEKWLSKSLSISSYANSVVAIASGIIAEFVVKSSGTIRPMFGATDDDTFALYFGGYITAMDLSIGLLVLCAILIACLWEENYGESKDNEHVSLRHGVLHHRSSRFCNCCPIKRSMVPSEEDGPIEIDRSSEEAVNESVEDGKQLLHGRSSDGQHLQSNDELERPLLVKGEVYPMAKRSSAVFTGIYTICQTPRLLICCIASSLFEGALFVFVVLWTPTLTSLQEQLLETSDDLPLGTIFSSFMICCLLGTIAFSFLSHASVSPTTCLLGSMALASVSTVMMASPLSAVGSQAKSVATTPQYFGMLVYEFSVGL